MSRRVVLNDERIQRIIAAPDDAIMELRIEVLRGQLMPSLTETGRNNMDNALYQLNDAIAEAIASAIIGITGNLDD